MMIDSLEEEEQVPKHKYSKKGLKKKKSTNQIKKSSTLQSKSTNLHNKSKASLKNSYEKAKNFSSMCIIQPKPFQVLKENVFENFFQVSFAEKIDYVGEYISEIYSNLLEEEKASTKVPNPLYMKNQKEINEQMRAILIDWLITVHMGFNLSPQVLFITVRLIDQYLSIKPIERVKLQLLGITALLIACKYEEIYYPNLVDFVHITDDAYEKNELVEMERNVLKILEYDITFPSQFDFFGILSQILGFNSVFRNLGLYFMESFLLDYNSLKYSPSRIACATAYIVMKFFHLDGYEFCYEPYLNSENLQQACIKETAQQMCFLVENLKTSKLNSTKAKYSSQKFCQVAMLLNKE